MNILDGLPTETLTPEREQELLKAGERQTILLHTLRSAFSYVQKTVRGRLPEGEILSVTYAALERSIKNFKPGMQTFLAFSKVYLRGEVSRNWRQKDPVKNAYKGYDDVEGPADEDPDRDRVEADFDGIHWRELLEQVTPVLDQHLTKNERRVVELRYLRGLNFREIGEILSQDRKVVWRTHSVAMQKIRKVLPVR